MKATSLATLVCACAVVGACGEQPSGRQAPSILERFFPTAFKPQIYLGEIVPPGRLRGVVGLTYGTARTPACTGALIAEDMVLTAAHCVCEQVPKSVFVGENPLSPPSRPYFEVVDFRAGYRCNDPNVTSANAVDVAVVEIKGRIRSVKPFAMTSATPSTGTDFLVSGYGATNPQGTTVDYRKREAKVPLVSASCSRSGDPARYRCQAGQEIVAGRLTTADTCRGDSGGALLTGPSGGDSKEADLMIVGVTSRGANGSTTCGEGGIYENLRPKVKDWVEKAMAAMRKTA